MSTTSARMPWISFRPLSRMSGPHARRLVLEINEEAGREIVQRFNGA